MKRCLIVETRDPLGQRDFEWTAELASGMRGQGVPTSLLLTENAVLGARPGVAPCLQKLLQDGVEISVDRFAMRERGIAEDNLMPGLIPAEINIVIDCLEAGAAVLWR